MSYDPSLFSAELPVETNEDREFRLWAKQLGASPELVREAVNRVGHQADAVRDYVSKRAAAA